MKTKKKKQQPLQGGNEVRLSQLLMKSGLFVQRELTQVCQQLGLNVNQFNVLNEIVSRGPLSQKELCERLLFEKSNISKIVKTLLGKNLINMATAPVDRRVTLLIETPEGIEVWKDCMRLFSESSQDLYTVLSAEEIHDVVELLKKLEYQFRELTDDK